MCVCVCAVEEGGERGWWASGTNQKGGSEIIPIRAGEFDAIKDARRSELDKDKGGGHLYYYFTE